jgi:hypothetical protein
MSDLSDTIKGFYSDFILRDLLSFVTPGAIVIGTMILALSNIDFNSRYGLQYFVLIINHIPIVFWILMFGIFYIVGVGLQVIGQTCSSFMMRKIGFLDLIFPPKEYLNKSRNIFGCPKETDNEKQNSLTKNMKKFFCFEDECRNAKYYSLMRLPFLSCSNNVEKKTHERFIVLMQTCGNCAIAFFFSGIVILIFHTRFGPFFFPVLGILFCFPLPIFFYFGFQDHRQKLLDWECEVVKKNHRKYHCFSNRSKNME